MPPSAPTGSPSSPPRPVADRPAWTIRDARPDDAGFLALVLAAAADWRSSAGPSNPDDVLAQPDIAHYVTGWPRPGDTGVVAEVDRPVGAAWYRFLTATDPGYGYVDPQTPELTVGVVAEHRGRGLGRALIIALLDRATAAGTPGVSLSVEDGNPARRLYERLGFVPVGRSGNSTTMARTLAPPGARVAAETSR